MQFPIPEVTRKEKEKMMKKRIVVEYKNNNNVAFESIGFNLEELTQWEKHIQNANIINRIELIRQFGNDFEVYHDIEVNDEPNYRFTIVSKIRIYAAGETAKFIEIPISSISCFDSFSFGTILKDLGLSTPAGEDFQKGLIPVEWFYEVDIDSL